jgi:hypothetical protein
MPVLALLFAAAGPAAAQTSRPDSLSLSCEQVQASIASKGAAIIGTGPYVYDRFVSDARFCASTQYARQDFIRTRNNPSCLVYVCRERTLMWKF